MLIDLFVNSVTVWDEDDNTYKVTVAYNLTSLPTKTYRLNKGGTLSDFTSNAPVKQRQRIYAHFFLGMSKADIAKAEGTHKSRITRSIEAGLRSLEKYFKEIL